MPRVTLTKIAVYPSVVLGAAAAGLLATGTAASAHGYVSAPPSRQALCAQRVVPDCGPIQFEPQSVEGPKGLKRCDGGLPQFSILNDNSRAWPVRPVGSTVTFTWVFTARHRTSNWEYFIGNRKVATVDGGNQQPAAVVDHRINLSAFPGGHAAGGLEHRRHTQRVLQLCRCERGGWWWSDPAASCAADRSPDGCAAADGNRSGADLSARGSAARGPADGIRRLGPGHRVPRRRRGDLQRAAVHVPAGAHVDPQLGTVDLHARAVAAGMRIVAVALIALAVLAGCGSDPKSAGGENAAAPAAPGTAVVAAVQASAEHNGADVMFLQMMIVHIGQGTELARIAADRAVDSQVRDLAAAITATQSEEANVMTGWLKGWSEPVTAAHDAAAHAAHGGLPAVSTEQVDALRGAAANTVDKMFLTLLIGHQHNAVEWVDAVAKDGRNPETKDLARRVKESRSDQIALMLRLSAG